MVRRVTLGAKGAKMCTQAPAPPYTMCTQAPAPDWLGPVLNQSGVLKFAAGAWVHILAPFALSVTRLMLGTSLQTRKPNRRSISEIQALNLYTFFFVNRCGD